MTKFTKKKNGFKELKLLTMTSAIVLTLAMGTAQAQQDSVDITIEAQSLSSALISFSRQTNFVVIGSSELLHGKSSVAIDGSYSPETALKMILEGSGLGYVKSDDGTVTIVVKGSATPDSNSQSSISSSADASTTNAENIEQAWGSVNGRVVDDRNGTPLVGALVRVEGTNLAAGTDDKGNFRFPKVISGSHIVSISYLGYRGMEVEVVLGGNETNSNVYRLGGAAAATEEIVVFGSRSARARALNQERLAENSSSVVSSDQMGDFVGTTLAEALRRVAGVTFIRDGATGSGTGIMIRGMNPDLNAVKMNGINLPSASSGAGFNRSANLSNVLADSVETVTIHKSLLPSHDSSGTGGLVEIVTKSPLARPDNYSNFSIERGMRSGDFSDDLLLSGTLSKVFGTEGRFGLSASVQYRDTSNTNISTSKALAFGTYMPLEFDGTRSINRLDQIDPTLNFPFEGGDNAVYTVGGGHNFNQVDEKTLAITLSSEWQVTNDTSWKLDFQRSDVKRDYTSLSTNVATFSQYLPHQVAALNGEWRNAVGFDGSGHVQQSYNQSNGTKDKSTTLSFRGNTQKAVWEFDYGAGFSIGKGVTPDSRLLTLQTLEGGLAGHVLDSAIDPVEGRILSLYGRYDDAFQLPQFTEGGWAFVNDPSSYNLGELSAVEFESKHELFEAQFSAKRNYDGEKLKYIQYGLEYKNSKNTDNSKVSFYRGVETFIFNPCCSLQRPLASDFGVGLVGANLSRIGHDQSVNSISQADAAVLFDNLDLYLAEPGALLMDLSQEPHPLEGKGRLKEETFVSYVQGGLEFGKLEVVGGFRLDHVNVSSLKLSRPVIRDEFFDRLRDIENQFTVLNEATSSMTSVLPRVSFNYRENENLVFRGGYFLTVERPSIADLSRNTDIQLSLGAGFGPNGDQPLLQVNAGNPDLKPAYTHNFDFSAEYYDQNIGVIKLGVFYKSINNLLESSILSGVSDLSGVDLPDHELFNDLPDNLYVNILKPVNNEDVAKVFGIEAHIERQFTGLPGAWNGLGFFANYTYTMSKKDFSDIWESAPLLDNLGNTIPLAGFGGGFGGGGFGGGFGGGPVAGDEDIQRTEQAVFYTGVPFFHQVPHSGTVALTYNKYNIDGMLSYTYQARKRVGHRPHGLHNYDESVSSLDLRVEYRFGGQDSEPYRIYLEAADLLKGKHEADLLTSFGGVDGGSKYLTGATYLGGRSFKVGLTASF